MGSNDSLRGSEENEEGTQTRGVLGGLQDGPAPHLVFTPMCSFPKLHAPGSVCATHRTGARMCPKFKVTV